MRTLTHHLATYAAYHRDRRNVATHMLGIPLIVLAVEILLSRPQWAAGALTLSPAMPAAAAAALFYVGLDAAFGAVMALLLALGAWAGLELARAPTALWLGAGLGAFVVGWIIQFVGHAYEGRKPAFLDDLSGLIIGPLFIVAEIAFALGLRRDLKARIEASHRA